MKICVTLLCMIAILTPGVGIAAEIVNISTSSSPHDLLVEYDLVGDKPSMINVNITVEGIRYNRDQLSLAGDIGRAVPPGNRKKFIWNAKRDFPKWPDLDVTVESSAHQP